MHSAITSHCRYVSSIIQAKTQGGTNKHLLSIQTQTNTQSSVLPSPFRLIQYPPADRPPPDEDRWLCPWISNHKVSFPCLFLFLSRGCVFTVCTLNAACSVMYIHSMVTRDGHICNIRIWVLEHESQFYLLCTTLQMLSSNVANLCIFTVKMMRKYYTGMYSLNLQKKSKFTGIYWLLCSRSNNTFKMVNDKCIQWFSDKISS